MMNWIQNARTIMNEQEKWNYINELDDQLLKGGVMLSEWTAFLVRDAQTAFCSDANLSSILACQAAIESHLKFDYFTNDESKKWGFYKLIENSNLNSDLKSELHELRLFRNKWVHVNDPENDIELLDAPEYHENELRNFAIKTMRIMLVTLYTSPSV